MIIINDLSGNALERIKDTVPNIIYACEKDISSTSFHVKLNDNAILKFYNNGSIVNLDLAGRITTIENSEFTNIILF